MGLSSAVSLVRSFCVAYFLLPSEFAQYAIVFALAAFFATVLGFGQIERSYKRFPRMFADGHIHQAVSEAARTTRLIIWRTVAIAAVLSLIVWSIGHLDWLTFVLAGCILSAAIAVQSSYISLQRAGQNLSHISSAALMRTVLALVLGSSGAVFAGALGALAGEILATVAGATICRYYANQLTSPSSVRADTPVPAHGKELWLFAGFFIAAMPLYVDRSVVSLLYGNDIAGRYAFLTLFVLGCYTITIVVSQKFGPLIVSMQHRGDSFRAQAKLTFQYCAIIAIISAAGVASAELAILHTPVGQLFSQYKIAAAYFTPILFLCVLQFTHLIEWLSIANNREKDVFVSSSAYVLALTGSVLYVAKAGDPLVTLLWFMVFAKTLHVIVLCACAARNRPVY